MVAIQGLVGLRPAPEHVAHVTAPPYDVIKEGSPLAARIRAESRSVVQVTLGEDPAGALQALRESGALVEDDEASHYVYEQTWSREVGAERRIGVFTAVHVSDYAEQNIIRHEKTFDAKVAGRIGLCKATGHVIGPIFLLTKAPLGTLLEEYAKGEALYDFVSDFGPGTDLDGVRQRVWKVPATDARLADLLANDPLYIADGHHRYHAALKGELSHTLAYVTEGAKIQAYNRVLTGEKSFSEAKEDLDLTPIDAFVTPAKNEFCIYTREGSFLAKAKEVPNDVVGRLDCSILEHELYPAFGLEHRHVVMEKHFDYYPESALHTMKEVVDAGTYEVAIALHPVSTAELLAVADAGLEDPSVVMPEKSTFFSPKILTGFFLQRV